MSNWTSQKTDQYNNLHDIDRILTTTVAVLKIIFWQPQGQQVMKILPLVWSFNVKKGRPLQ